VHIDDPEHPDKTERIDYDRLARELREEIIAPYEDGLKQLRGTRR
jgi:hypothetical protein